MFQGFAETSNFGVGRGWDALRCRIEIDAPNGLLYSTKGCLHIFGDGASSRHDNSSNTHDNTSHAHGEDVSNKHGDDVVTLLLTEKQVRSLYVGTLLLSSLLLCWSRWSLMPC